MTASFLNIWQGILNIVCVFNKPVPVSRTEGAKLKKKVWYCMNCQVSSWAMNDDCTYAINKP